MSARLCLALLGLGLISGCGGEQSVFSASGEAAAAIVRLTWWMFYAAVVITIIVGLATLLALWGPLTARRLLSAERTIVWGGIVFPVVVLCALLFWGFFLLGQNNTSAQVQADLRITVIGEQWWWRVIYHHADGSQTETANELRIPTNTNVRLILQSADVIHSFWVPPWHGKVDMIPGKTNYLTLNIQQPGTVRGQCAEYCGGAHALMAFYAVAMPAGEFDQWLAGLREPAVNTASQGATTFLETGCGACHSVRGTEARGRIGPALTHVGGRLSLGAGIMPARKQDFQNWLAEHQRLKPENRMPAFEFLTDSERESLAQYLLSLE